AAPHGAAEEVREAALALSRLTEAAPQVEILDPQDALLAARLVEDREASLLPLAEIRHAGDHALAGQPPHVMAAVEVLVDRVPVLLQALRDPLPDQRRLARPGWADHRGRPRPLAAEQIGEPLAV